MAPLIVPIVTITPLPLLYHIRTFYIARYASSKSPTYTFNEVQKKPAVHPFRVYKKQVVKIEAPSREILVERRRKRPGLLGWSNL